MATVETEVIAPRQPIYYNDYSPEFKAQALAAIIANGGNVNSTANELNVAESTLRGWLNQASRWREFREQKQEDLAVKIEYNAHKLAESIADHDLTDVPLAQKATAMGIMVDKMQLLRGQPTSITHDVNAHDLAATLAIALNAGCIDITPE